MTAEERLCVARAALVGAGLHPMRGRPVVNPVVSACDAAPRSSRSVTTKAALAGQNARTAKEVADARGEPQRTP